MLAWQVVRSLCEIEFELDRISAHLVEELATQRGMRGNASLPTSPKDRTVTSPRAGPAELQAGPGILRQRPSYSSALGSLGDLAGAEGQHGAPSDIGSTSIRMPVSFLDAANAKHSSPHGRSVSMDNSDLPSHLEQEVAEHWRQRPGLPAGLLRPDLAGRAGRSDSDAPRPSRMSSTVGLTEANLLRRSVPSVRAHATDDDGMRLPATSSYASLLSLGAV